MKKIPTYSKFSIYLLFFSVISVFTLFFGFTITYFVLKDKYPPIITFGVILPAFILVTILLSIYFSKKEFFKTLKYIEIDNIKIVYDNTIFMPICQIEKIEYNREETLEKMLCFYMNNGHINKIMLSKRVVKKIQKELNIKIKYNLKKKRKKYKEKINDLKTLIKNNKKYIISTIIGLFITIISFTVHILFKQKLLLDIILCIISFIYGVLQFYYVYISSERHDNTSKLILSIILSIGFVIIASLAILLFMFLALKVDSTIYVIVWATYLLPSFIVVIAIIALILEGL